jgi:phage-related minor tail protein
MANTVTVEVKADTSKAQSNIGKFGAKVKGAMPAITAVGAVTTGAAMAAVKLGDEFKTAERLIAAGTGASGSDLESLQESFHNVFKDVPNDSAEVAQAIADLNTEFGLTGAELETATTQMLNASTAMGVDLGSSIKTVADGMQIFGVDASEMGTVMDSLAAASQATGVPMDELASKVQTFGPVLKNAGFSMEEATAFFGSLEQNGIDVTRVMPGINAAMRKLSEQGVTDLKGAMEEQMVAIKGATTDSEALNLATKAFGAEGAQRMSLAIRNGNLDLGALLETMDGSEGTINNLAESTQTTADKFNIMKNNVKSNLAPIGEMAGTMGPLVVMIPGMATAVGGLSGAMGMLNLSMGPVLIAIVAIAAAIALAVIVWKNWDTIVEGSKMIWEGLKTAISNVLEGIWTAIKFYVNLWIGAFNLIIKGINKIKFDVPSWVPGLGGKGFAFNIPTITPLAKGGIVKSPTLAMIGEQGAEAVVPLNKSGLGNININITGDVYGFDDFEDRVAEAVRDGARRGGFQGVLNTA